VRKREHFAVFNYQKLNDEYLSAIIQMTNAPFNKTLPKSETLHFARGETTHLTANHFKGTSSTKNFHKSSLDRGHLVLPENKLRFQLVISQVVRGSGPPEATSKAVFVL
jgi:hypothetical protein